MTRRLIVALVLVAGLGGCVAAWDADDTARFEHGWLVLSGTAIGPFGEREAIFHELTGDPEPPLGTGAGDVRQRTPRERPDVPAAGAVKTEA